MIPDERYRKLDPASVGDFEPIEVLIEYEQPLSFTIRDAGGELRLAHLYNESEMARLSVYLVVPITEEMIRRLKAGEVDMRTALTHPRVWLANRRWGDGKIAALWEIDFDRLPPDSLPVAGTTLYPEISDGP
jgi:hypothetical protein